MYNHKQFRINNKWKIIDVAFELSLEKGFDNVSMKQIQEKTGLSTGSLYQYFQNKEDILLFLVDKYILKGLNQLQKNIEEFDGSFIEKIEYIFDFKTSRLSKETLEYEYIHAKKDFIYLDYFILITSIYHHHPEIRHLFHDLHDKMYIFTMNQLKKLLKTQK